MVDADRLTTHQQPVAIGSRRCGAARAYTRAITPDALMNGGVLQGVQLDLVSYIITGLQLCFAQLDDARRLYAMAHLLAFTRDRSGNINVPLARYAVVCARAAHIGNFAMSWE